MLGESGPCAKFQLDRITESGSFLTFLFPPAQDRQTERERDAGEVNIRDLKKKSWRTLLNTSFTNGEAIRVLIRSRDLKFNPELRYRYMGMGLSGDHK